MSGFVVAFTLLGLVRHDHWLVRMADFPRLQLLVLGLASLLGLASFALGVFAERLGFWHWLLLFTLMGALAYQAYMVLPFTPLWRKQVNSARSTDPERTLKLLSVNVLMTNTHHHKLIAQINRHQPDVVVTLESDANWEAALRAIEKDYPYQMAEPLDNLYGMHLYSKLELIEPKVAYLFDENIPSIHAKVVLPSGERVRLYCLHPMPPSPTEAADATLRDAEILMVGKHIKKHGKPSIVLGDLNDVAWSRTTKLFTRISGLLDPRVGRGFFNTFHAKLPLLRWSLDHIFHSPCFELNQIQRMPSIGSDHFGMLVDLQLEPKAAAEQCAPQKHEGDEEAAKEKIRSGLQKVRRQKLKRLQKLRREQRAHKHIPATKKALKLLTGEQMAAQQAAVRRVAGNTLALTACPDRALEKYFPN